METIKPSLYRYIKHVSKITVIPKINLLKVSTKAARIIGIDTAANTTVQLAVYMDNKTILGLEVRGGKDTWKFSRYGKSYSYQMACYSLVHRINALYNVNGSGNKLVFEFFSKKKNVYFFVLKK